MPNVSFLFGWTLIAALMGHLIVPKLHTLYFMPFLGKISTHLPLPQSLIWAFICGLALDLTYSHSYFGFESWLFVLTLCVSAPVRRFFFDDKPHAIIFYTAWLSFSYTILKLLFLAIFATLPRFTWKGICSELFIMPFVDGILGFFWFTCPLTLFKLGRKRFISWKHR